MSLGNHIQQLRLEKKYSQRKLALLADVSNTTISRIESDSVTPDMETLSKIANALKVDIGSLISYVDSSDSNIDNVKFTPKLTQKDEKDIGKKLEEILASMNTDDDLMLYNNDLDDETRELLIASIERTLRQAKLIAKEKFTPNKYKK